ncbi:unnamed protein product [Rhizophagus irregularis]|nr:unnamed protein product [Rhizophagus irregularis]
MLSKTDVHKIMALLKEIQLKVASVCSHITVLELSDLATPTLLMVSPIPAGPSPMVEDLPVITSSSLSSITSNSSLTSHHILLSVSCSIPELAYSQEYVTQTNIKSKMDLLANSIEKFISSIGIASTSEQAMDASSN